MRIALASRAGLARLLWRRHKRAGSSVGRLVVGSFALDRVGPTSDLDVLVVRDTTLGIVDRVADLKLAAQLDIPIDMIVVTPSEYRSTFAANSFGRTLIAQARRIYAACSLRHGRIMASECRYGPASLGPDRGALSVAQNRLDLFHMRSRYLDALGGADPSKVLQYSDAELALVQARSVFAFAREVIEGARDVTA